MFFSSVKCTEPITRHERIFGERLNIAPGHSYIETVDRGTTDPAGALIKYTQVSGAADSYLQVEGTTGILEYGLTANGTDQVLWTLNQTVFPANHALEEFEPIKTTKLTAICQPVQIVGGGIFGAIIGQNVALDEYGRHAFFRYQNTNGGTIFAVDGRDQDISNESELLTGIQNLWLQLELTIRSSGMNLFKATNLSDGSTAEYNSPLPIPPISVMNLMLAAEGGGPQKYRIYYWRLDYD